MSGRLSPTTIHVGVMVAVGVNVEVCVIVGVKVSVGGMGMAVSVGGTTCGISVCSGVFGPGAIVFAHWTPPVPIDCDLEAQQIGR